MQKYLKCKFKNTCIIAKKKKKNVLNQMKEKESWQNIQVYLFLQIITFIHDFIYTYKIYSRAYITVHFT